jgi:hypothetical protein
LTASTIRSLKPVDAADLRDKLPTSGVFDMVDCAVEIYCPENSTTEDIQKMVATIENMINVVDVRISATPEKAAQTTYEILITEVPSAYRKGLKERE